MDIFHKLHPGLGLYLDKPRGQNLGNFERCRDFDLLKDRREMEFFLKDWGEKNKYNK